MIGEESGFSGAAAHLEDQATLMGDWAARQYITLALYDQHGELEPAFTALTSGEARDLAYRLLELAEHADRRAEEER
jgi:hypothetical protein